MPDVATDLRLSLEHMTVAGMPVDPIIDTAEDLCVEHISLILDTGPYELGIASFLKTPSLVASTVQRLRSSPVTVHATEGFLLGQEPDFGHMERLLEVTARLGSTMGVVMVIDPDRSRAADNLARLCERARPAAIVMSVEFVATTPVATLADGCALVAACGAENAAVSCDILHIVRSGGSPADICATDFRLGAAQLCDGPALLPRDLWEHEGVAGRLLPGEGEFPLDEFLSVLPRGTVVGVETPMGIPAAGPALVRAASRSIAAARALTTRFALVSSADNR